MEQAGQEKRQVALSESDLDYELSKSMPRNVKSQNGSLDTFPQASNLLYLPSEIRLTIWELYLHGTWNTSLQHHFNVIKPVKDGQKFKNTFLPSNKNTILKLLVLSKVCRQIHLDLTSWALVYKLNSFNFRTPTLMNTFLTTIRPHYKNAIRKIHLRFCLTQTTPKLQGKCFQLLADCKGLRHLKIHVSVDQSLCEKLRRGHEIPDLILARIWQSARVRKIDGLLSFELMLTIDKRFRGSRDTWLMMMWFSCQNRELSGAERYQGLFVRMQNALMGWGL